MGRFDNTGLSQWNARANSPAAPEGARQASRAAAGYQSGSSRFAGSRLGKWSSEKGLSATAGSWYSGQNLRGTNNGWDTTFFENAAKGQERAMKEGRFGQYFDQDYATGVVTYDQKNERGGNDLKFGDIYEGGKKVGNVYDQFDKETADKMMSVWLFDGDEMRRIMGASDRDSRLGSEVQSKREWNNVNMPKQLKALEFQADVEDREDDIRGSKWGKAIPVGGAVGGAGTGAAAGATLGSIVPLFGTAAGAIGGAIIGGVVGGVGSWLNRDELTEQAARAAEVSELSRAEQNLVAGGSTTLKEWSGFAMNLTSPLTQAVHGAKEVATGGVGDKDSAFYAVDEKGESKTGLGWHVLGLSAAVADGAAQFMNPINRAVYTAQIGGVIAGSVGELAATGGETFDPRSGDFDNIFLNDTGGADPLSAAAGIVNIGIDAVQIGGLRGLAKATRKNREAIENGGQITDVAGFRYTLDETGTAVSRKPTMALLVPSEQFPAWSVQRKARIDAMGKPGTIDVDDYYRAAMSLSNSDNRIKAAIANGFGEGYEEVVQAVAEPISHDGKLAWGDVANAFFYGAAGGAGMSLGATGGAVNSDARMKARAAVTYKLRFDEEMPDEWWDSKSEQEKRIASTVSREDAMVTRAALKQIVKEQSTQMVASEIDAAKALDSQRAAVDADLKTATEATDAYTRIGAIIDSSEDIRPEAAQASARKVYDMLAERFKGIKLQQPQLVQRSEQLAAQLAEQEAAEQDTAETRRRLAETTELLQTTRAAEVAGAQIIDRVEDALNRMFNVGSYRDEVALDERDLRATVDNINRFLENAFDQKYSGQVPEGVELDADQLRIGAAHFISILSSREPKLDAGSYPALLPQIDWLLTQQGSDNLININQDLLQAMNADFDGDDFRGENQLVVTTDQLAQIRSGQTLGGVGKTIDVATRNFDEAMTEALGDALQADGDLRDSADATYDHIVEQVTDRYGEMMSAETLQSVLDNFRADLLAGEADARTNLIDGIYQAASQKVNDHGLQTWWNEPLWISRLVRSSMQTFQRDFRRMRAEATGPTPGVESEAELTPEGTNHRKQQAVTDAQTLAVFAVGNSLFRKFQKLHYSWYNSRVLRAADTERSDLTEMAATLAELGRNVTRSEMAQVRAESTTEARALAMLNRLVDSALRDPEISRDLNPATAASVLANIKVKDVWYEDGVPVTNDQTISLGQLMLKRAVEAERDEFARILPRDDKLRARLDNLYSLTFPEDLNAEKTFVKLFGAMSFGDSVGRATGNLNVAITPEQWLRTHQAATDEEKRQMIQALKDVPEYLDRQETSNLPYSLSEAERREVSAYRSMVDSLIAVANSRLTFDKNATDTSKAISGDLARPGLAAKEAFFENFDLVRTAVDSYRRLVSRYDKGRKLNAELIQEMFNADPAYGRQILDLIPDAAANGLYEYRVDPADGQEKLFADSWIYEMFALENRDQALMFYLRNLIMTQWNATRQRMAEADPKTMPNRVYSKLSSRIQQVMYELANEPGQQGLERFIRALTEFNNADDFMFWVNTQPGIRGKRAPLVLFNDDVAAFEANVSGFNIPRPGVDLQLKIRNLRDIAPQFVKNMEFREQKDATDREYYNALLRAHNDDPQATEQDHLHLERFKKVLRTSHDLPRGFSPSSFLAMARGALRGFDANSTDKGKTPTSFDGFGQFQALMDGFGFMTGFERTLEDINAHSMSSLETNLGDLGKLDGKAMNSDGQQINLQKLDVGSALEMLGDYRTAPLAFAMLAPTAMELTDNGTLADRVLFEPSLEDLLKSNGFSDVYAPPGKRLTIDQASRYISTIDAYGRNHGGENDAARAVVTEAIARTSALDRPATNADYDRFIEEATISVAERLMMVGSLQASPTARNSNVLDDFRKATVKQMRERAKALRLPDFSEDGLTIEETWVEVMKSDLEDYRLEKATALTEQYDGDELTTRLEALNRQHQSNLDRLDEMLEDDLVTAAIDKYRVTPLDKNEKPSDAAALDAKAARDDAAARRNIVRVVRSTANASVRMPESELLIVKLNEQIEAGQVVTLKRSEWLQLSRSVQGMTLADRAIPAASHITTVPYPAGDPASSDARAQKFFDPSFSFLADQLMDPDSPMTAAATWFHQRAERPIMHADYDKIARTLQNSLLDPKLTGRWTPSILSQMVEFHERMDSSGGPATIAQSGNLPKRWAAIQAASRRTADSAGIMELLTTTEITGDQLLDPNVYNTVRVTPAGGTAEVDMPLAQLNNRFFGAVRFDGEEVPLDYENIGYVWDGDPNEDAPPLRYIATDRLTRALELWARRNDKDPKAVVVSLDFLHPNSKPAGWHHNAYFEGMNHTITPDGSLSLIASGFAANGGLTAFFTQAGLDASKTGNKAINPYKRPPANLVSEARAAWESDRNFARMIELKTQILMTDDQGYGALPVESYNFVHKIQKMLNMVVGQTADGTKVVLLADEVIAQQNAGLPLQDADGNELVPGTVRHVELSPEVLRTVVGETGTQGVDTYLDLDYELNPDSVQLFTGISSHAMETFGSGWFEEPGSLADTHLTNVGQQRVLRVRSQMTTKERSAREDRIIRRDSEKARIQSKRARLTGGAAKIKTDFLSVLQLAKNLIGTERSSLDFASTNMGVYVAPRDTHEASHTLRQLQAVAAAADGTTFERAFVIRDQGGPDYPNGILTVDHLTDPREDEDQAVKDDWMLVDLVTFKMSERTPVEIAGRIERALRYAMDSGTTIVLGSGDGTGNLRADAAEFLMENDYVRVAGSAHIFAPADSLYKTQNQRAYESTLTETQRIATRRHSVGLLAIDPIGTDENVAILNPLSTKLRDRKILNNVLPSSLYANYNLPREDNQDTGVYARALAHLRTITDPAQREHRAALLEMGGQDPDRLMPLADALDRFHTKITSRASLVPEVGDVIEIGDIVPFINSAGKVILYRHGFKRPEVESLNDLHAMHGGMNVAVGRSERDPAVTSNSGTITALEPRAGLGNTLILETPLQPVGDKIQLAWNGMKYIMVNPGKDTYFPERIFQTNNGVVADFMSDVRSADKKEAYKGRVNNYRSALAFFEFDFLDDMVKFFYPGEAVTDARRTLTYNILKRLERQDEYRLPLLTAADLSRAESMIAEFASSFAAAEEGVSELDVSWASRLNSDDATGQIAWAVIAYLMTPHANVDNILRSGGFSQREANTEQGFTREVPGLFADLLDRGMNAPLHTELIKRFDRQLFAGADGSGVRLLPNWKVQVFQPNGEGMTEYFLQYGEAISSGDNPVTDGEAFDINERRAVSAHNAAAAGGSIGALTVSGALAKSRAFKESFRQGAGVAKFGGGTPDGLWDMISALPVDDTSRQTGMPREKPLETARRVEARGEIIGLYQPLNKDGGDWTANNNAKRNQYSTIVERVFKEMNFYGHPVEIFDTWVRDSLGRPHGEDAEGNELGVITADDAIETATLILNSVRKGLFPQAGGEIPLIDEGHLLALYMANANLPDDVRWAPRLDLAPNSQFAQSWDTWIDAAFGTAFDEERNPRFEAMYTLAVDGRIHRFQDAHSELRDLPVSSDSLRAKQLMDPTSNKLFVSMSADENFLATDPVLWDSRRSGLEEIVVGPRIYTDKRGEPDVASAKGRQKARIDRWYKEIDAPRPTQKRIRGVRGPGQTFLGHSTYTSAMWRNIMNLRVGNTLISPPLIVMAPIEAFYRRNINMFADISTGESIGMLGRAQSRLYEAVQDKSLGAVADFFGVVPRYTTEDQKLAKDLVSALSQNDEWRSMIYKELMFQYPSMPGIGKIQKALERYAKFGGRLQDPAWGMLPGDLARIYVSTMMRNIQEDNLGNNVYSTQRAILSMARNPEWLKGNDLEAHNMAVNAISQVRAVKSTFLSLLTRGFVEPLSENPKFLPNTAGNFLKVMTAFQNYFANALTTMTGLQGAADFMAFLVDGREKKIGRRIQAFLGGREFDTRNSDYYDMSEVLESVDLIDSFIRGGVTHTGLFLLGMAAGGIGLSGEDDEAKWRRRQAELQGGAYYRDPRALEADMANKDALYLNWLPDGIGDQFKVPKVGGGFDKIMQMNFMSRSILSPILGMEKFFETGDFMEVIHGYKDALGSHPLINEQLWNSAVETTALLHEEAALSAESDDPGTQAKAAGLLITGVGIMERMLMENASLNMLYVGMDQYDRDPTKMVELLDGKPRVDVMGEPTESTALQEFLDPDGKVQSGFIDRPEGPAAYRALSEQRFGLAFLGSLFHGVTGKGFTGSDFSRYNMAVRTRDVELDPLDEKTTTDHILAAFYRGNVNTRSLTEDEAASIILDEARARGVWIEPEMVEKLAKQRAAASGIGALSIVGEDGKERPTPAGARAIVQGLMDRTVDLGDASLRGTFIAYETRIELQEQWMKELVQEGVNLGLSNSKAQARMKRLWFGEYGVDGTVGLQQILFSKEIPYTDTLKYNQLNTTYVTGIDGYPRATGFTRDGLFGALGLKVGNRPWSTGDNALPMDSRMNAVDEVAGINTGMRALQKRSEDWVPASVQEEVKKAAEEIVKAIEDITLTPQDDRRSGGGGGFGGFGGGGGGYGGGGSYAPHVYFSKMNPFPGMRAPYASDIPFINTSNPIIRRGDIRRERVWSERGRLKQWQ